jgi:hypothetical protein
MRAPSLGTDVAVGKTTGKGRVTPPAAISSFARRFVAHSDGWEQDDACELWNVNLRKWQPATVKTLETKASDAWRGVAWRGVAWHGAARRGAAWRIALMSSSLCCT